MVKKFVALALVLVACSGPVSDPSGIADLPVVDAQKFETLLANLDSPAVVHVWASWCIPCRAEASLFNKASEAYGDEIEFIGVDVQDSQIGAKQFLNEFGLEFDHFFDRNRSIANHYGGIGTPITFFFGPHAQLVSTHNGIVDDRTLAMGIDELLQLGS